MFAKDREERGDIVSLLCAPCGSPRSLRYSFTAAKSSSVNCRKAYKNQRCGCLIMKEKCNTKKDEPVFCIL